MVEFEPNFYCPNCGDRFMLSPQIDAVETSASFIDIRFKDMRVPHDCPKVKK